MTDTTAENLPSPTPRSPDVSGDSGEPLSADDARATVLVVDLDGSLIASDMLWESYIAAVKARPLRALWLPLALLKGRAAFKRLVAAGVTIDVEALPYRAEVLEFICRRHRLGRTVVLATAADRSLAIPIAEHLQLFDAVLTGDGVDNLKGSRKLSAIQVWCAENRFEQFDYLGDSRADLPVWRRSARKYVVGTPRFVATVSREFELTRVFPKPSGGLFAALRAMRPKQWVKNLLVFLPLLLAHRLGDTSRIYGVVAAFWSFCACASAIYIVNDLVDLDADRRHPNKRRRPFASGDLPLVWGPPLALGLVAASLVAAVWLAPAFLGILALYIGLTTLYSFHIKRVVLLDVFLLAGLYTLRIFAGGIAADVPVSEWLLMFSGFLFTSIAFAKRYAELLRLSGEGADRARGRGYHVVDLGLIETIGPAAGIAAVLVLGLYIHSDAMRALYSRPWAVWLICPLLAYWISRLWLLARRGELDEDPMIFAFRDPVSLAIGALTALLAVIAAVV